MNKVGLFFKIVLFFSSFSHLTLLFKVVVLKKIKTMIFSFHLFIKIHQKEILFYKILMFIIPFLIDNTHFVKFNVYLVYLSKVLH